MNNYYTLFHLLLEIRDAIINKSIVKSITPRKDVLEIYIENEVSRDRIVVDTSNNRSAFFLDEYRPEKRSNILHFFESIQGKEIKDIRLANQDRLIYLMLENGNYLQVVLFGPRANVFLIENGIITDAFKNTDQIGQHAIEPVSVMLWKSPDKPSSIKRRILQLNPLLPREWIPDIIQKHHPGNLNADDLLHFVREITTELGNHPIPRISSDGRLCLFPERIISLQKGNTFYSINSAIKFAYFKGFGKARLQDVQGKILSKLTSRKESWKKQQNELKNIDKSIQRADRYEQMGHLVMSNIFRKEFDHQSEITVENVFRNNEGITIALKPELDLAGNAKRYYDKARKARKSYEAALVRKNTIEDELVKIEPLIEDVQKITNNSDLQKWMKNHRDELDHLGIASTKENQVHQSYRKTQVGKYEVWIGKNAKSNDDVTFSAHKEDIWLHARGVSGSHVVIRMNNDKNFPPREILIKVASLAAYYSKAKGSAMAPVSYTKKKFVRKPKGATPGLVYLDREDVIMVEPQSTVS